MYDLHCGKSSLLEWNLDLAYSDLVSASVAIVRLPYCICHEWVF